MRGELSAAQAGTLPASWALSLSNWSWSPPHQLSCCLLEGGEAQECQTESLKEEKKNKTSGTIKRDSMADEFTRTKGGGGRGAGDTQEGC